jgi:hypothetical protein
MVQTLLLVILLLLAEAQEARKAQIRLGRVVEAAAVVALHRQPDLELQAKETQAAQTGAQGAEPGALVATAA